MSRVIVVLLAASLVAGCAAIKAPEPERVASHLLEARLAPAAARPRRDVVLGVAIPRARPGFETAQMAYAMQPHTLEYFARNRWIDTPASMLGPIIAQELERAGSVRAVVRLPSSAGIDVRLDTEVLRLVQDFGARPSRVQIGLRATLIDVGTRRVVAVAELEESEPAARDDPYAGVLAANRALERLLGRLAEFCDQALVARSGGQSAR